MKPILLSLFSALFFAFAGCQSKTEVDLIVIGQIHQGPGLPTAEAMAIHDGIIKAVGSEMDINSRFKGKATEKLAHVYPGWHDAHCHFLGLGLSMQKVDLSGTESYQEVVERCRAFNQKQNLGYITGRGWDHTDWGLTEMPSNELLNEAFPDIPVVIRRVDGHAALANDFALNQAGFTLETQIDGGEIQVIDGKLNGILNDNAVDTILNKLFPEPSPEQKKEALLLAQEKCLQYGLTSLTDAGLPWDDIQVISESQKSGDLKIRINSMVSYSPEALNGFDKAASLESDFLRIRSIKVYADGALGSRGACLLHPYHDRDNWHGYMITSLEEMKRAAERCLEMNIQVCTHAIGDSANRTTLNVYDEILPENSDARWRIEHAQVVHPTDQKKFDGKRIIPSVQPTHATSDMYWAESRLGPDRVKNAYAYANLLNQAKVLPLGTDFPVEKVNPYLTWFAASTRQDLQGFPEGGFLNDQALSFEEIWKGMTLDPAYSAHLEDKLGSLEPGKFADFIVFTNDIQSTPAEKIPDLRPELVFIGGVNVLK